MAGSSSHRDTACSVRPEDAAASSRLVISSWAAGPQMSFLLASSIVKTKWPAIRLAASTLFSPASMSTQNRRPAAVTAWGSNVQIREPDAARSSTVTAHRSALTLVATTGPGADST